MKLMTIQMCRAAGVLNCCPFFFLTTGRSVCGSYYKKMKWLPDNKRERDLNSGLNEFGEKGGSLLFSELHGRTRGIYKR
jgi:hypothetical protein